MKVKLRFKGSDPWLEQGVHEVIVCTDEDGIVKVYVQTDISNRTLKLMYYDNPNEFWKDWEKLE